MTEISKNSKSNLAKLMATENIMVEHHNVHTAYFDVKNRILGIPIWKDMSDDLYDCMIGHEIGHALETPADGFAKGIETIDSSNRNVVKGYLNVVEDARIEKLVKRRYPGMKRSFLLGYQEMFNRDFFELKNQDINEIPFIDRINIHFKAGVLKTVSFTDEEMVYVRAIENCETFEDVIAVSKKLYEYCKTLKNNNAKSNTIKWDIDDDYEGQKSNSVDNSDNSDIDNDAKKSEENSEAIEGKSKDIEKKSEKEKVGGQPRGAGGSENNIIDGSVPPDAAKTDEALEKARESLTKNDKDNVYVNIPDKINLENIIVDYKKVHEYITNHYKLKTNTDFSASVFKEYQIFKSTNDKVVNHMVKEFEMRKAADEYSRAAISRTGVLDTAKLHAYKYNEDLFKKVTTITGGKNHGLVMFIDMSGSMQSHIPGTIDQLMTLVTFCRKVNIPYEVYGFTDQRDRNNGQNWVNSKYGMNKKADYGLGDLILNNDFTLRNYFSSRMTNPEHNQAMINMACYKMSYNYHNSVDKYSHVWAPPADVLNGTPLDDAVIAARKIVMEFKTKNKIQIVNTIFLTDGQSNAMTSMIDRDDRGNLYAASISGYFNNVILRDKNTKLNYTSSKQNSYYSVTTSNLLMALRDYTKSNVIGFYICGLRDARHKIYASDMKNDKTEGLENFKKNNFVEIEDQGYNPYFLIHNKSLDVDDQDFLDATKDIKEYKKNSLARKFKEFNKNKTGNRVVVSRFIEKISKELS